MSLSINKKSMTVGLVIALIVGFAAGKLLSGGADAAHDHAAETATEGAAKAQIWTCSMHPQIQQPEPGDCPICGMDLIPLKTDGGNDLGARELKLSKTARELAQIQVQPVERLVVEREVRMVGSVTYDETRLATITAWVGGRLDRLYVDYTGIAVGEGDHMVWMYSPDILAAQEELIQAKRAVASMQDNPSKLVMDSARATLNATRDKLRLWGLNQEQIEKIERRGTASDHIQINAPIGGIVIHKNATEGEYVKTGTPIYKIADLKQVWVKLDAYESDLSWLRYGQAVHFTTEAYPGQMFTGRVSFIDPVLTEKTRTVKVRVNVPNEDGRLKPGMFVRAVAKAQLATGGKVIDEKLAGKWIGPMHPEIIRDEPGDCPICGMPLKKAEALGFVSLKDVASEIPLVIPETAPMITGKRAVVYVQNPTDPSRFAGREIILGPRAAGYYIVDAGLEEGEQVVTQGNFKIDSALQIQAKPSMMNPAGGGGMAGHQHGDAKSSTGSMVEQSYDVSSAFTAQLKPLFDLYVQVQQSLAGDKLNESQVPARALVRRLLDVDMGLLQGSAHDAWMEARDAIRKGAKGIENAADIGAARESFGALSATMIQLGKRFGTGYHQPVYILHCPMALDDKGADWLQLVPDTANPFFGAAMLGCGEVTGKIEQAHSPKSGGGATGYKELPPVFTESFGELVSAYLDIQDALSHDNVETATTAATRFVKGLDTVDMQALAQEPHMAWMKSHRELAKTAGSLGEAESIEPARKAFAQLSEAMAEAISRFGTDLDRPVFKLKCPMAFNNRGAIWLQGERAVANPYFGDAMFGCGEVVETLNSAAETGGEEHRHE